MGSTPLPGELKDGELDIGETELRGFEDPVRLYELRWREAG